jgi:peptidoglycan/LPS O-acetylase OafA/YrhL
VLRSRRLQAVLEDRRLLFAGAVSYPLYLVHNEMGVGLINHARTWMPAGGWPLLPFMMLAVMLGAAWLVARFLEPPATRRLRTLMVSAPAGGRMGA